MTDYYRIMPGAKSALADACLSGGFIGGDWGVGDLSGHLVDDYRAFNKWFIPMYLESRPEKTRVSAGLAGGMLWTISKGLSNGDVILVPDKQGIFHFGHITGDYQFVPEGLLPHRRPVTWLPTTIHRHDLSEALQNSVGSTGTVANVRKHAAEIEGILGGQVTELISTQAEEVEDPAAFALEEHLEAFLVANWDATEFGKTHRIFEEDGQKVGQQYLTDTGPLDILAVSNDGKELLVIELKRGRASDRVVGQIQRYMGYVKDELAAPGQIVRGAIIALEDDKNIRRALSVANNIEFYRYRLTFSLQKA